MDAELLNKTISALGAIEKDSGVSRNIRLKLHSVIKCLTANSEMSISISKALGELGDVADDPNIDPCIRVQALDIISMLEKIM